MALMEFLNRVAQQRRLRGAPFYLLLILTTVITLVPIIWVFASALKSEQRNTRESPGIAGRMALSELH